MIIGSDAKGVGVIQVARVLGIRESDHKVDTVTPSALLMEQ